MTFAGIPTGTSTDDPAQPPGPLRPLDHGPLPPALQAAVAASLRGGERVLWLGRPGRAAAAGAAGQRLGGLVLLGLAGVAAVFARDTLDSLNVDWNLPWLRDGLLLGSGLLLAAPALLLAALSLHALARPRRLRAALRRIAYVVTTARALLVIESDAAAPYVRPYRRSAMRRAAVLPRRAGRGDVLLPTAAPAGDALLSALLGGRDGFADIESPREIGRLLARVAAARRDA